MEIVAVGVEAWVGIGLVTNGDTPGMEEAGETEARVFKGGEVCMGTADGDMDEIMVTFLFVTIFFGVTIFVTIPLGDNSGVMVTF